MNQIMSCLPCQSLGFFSCFREMFNNSGNFVSFCLSLLLEISDPGEEMYVSSLVSYSLTFCVSFLGDH